MIHQMRLSVVVVALGMFPIDSHCGSPCDTRVCGEKSLANGEARFWCTQIPWPSNPCFLGKPRKKLAFFERGEKTPTPKISAILRKRPVLRRANFVLTKDRKRPHYRHFCGKMHGRGLEVVKRPGVLSKVQMLNLILGVGVFPLLPIFLCLGGPTRVNLFADSRESPDSRDSFQGSQTEPLFCANHALGG